MKLVVKPPASTTGNFGRPVQILSVPTARDASLIGVPAVRAKAKQALMMPEMVATMMPFL